MERRLNTYESGDSVTIVICAYTQDRLPTLQRALEVARKQIDHRDELILVVDHNDALLSQYQSFFNDFRILSNSHRRGLSGARNTALAAAQGSIVAFLDDDAIPLDGWLEALRAPYADKRVYGVGGLAKPRWLNDQPSGFLRIPLGSGLQSSRASFQPTADKKSRWR